MLGNPLLLGHRGTRLRGAPPENTIAAFDEALENGCDGFEFDVRRTACGRALICHDETSQGVRIAEATCGELTSLPCLTDVLARYSRTAFLDIELKVPGLESDVLVALREHPPEHGYVVSSFLPDLLTELRTRSGDVCLGYICDRKKNLDLWAELPIQYVIPKQNLISAPLVQAVHRTGKSIVTWTVNDPRTMRRMVAWGVSGIISDDPALLVKTCRGAGVGRARIDRRH